MNRSKRGSVKRKSAEAPSAEAGEMANPENGGAGDRSVTERDGSEPMQWSNDDRETVDELEENAVGKLQEECNVLLQDIDDLASMSDLATVCKSPNKATDYILWLNHKERELKGKVELLQNTDPVLLSNENMAVEVDLLDGTIAVTRQLKEMHDSVLKQRHDLEKDIEREKTLLRELKTDRLRLKQTLDESTKILDLPLDVDQGEGQMRQLRQCLKNDEAKVKTMTREFLRNTLVSSEEGAESEEARLASMTKVIEELIKRKTDDPASPYVTAEDGPLVECLLRAGVIVRHKTASDKFRLCDID